MHIKKKHIVHVSFIYIYIYIYIYIVNKTKGNPILFLKK